MSRRLVPARSLALFVLLAAATFSPAHASKDGAAADGHFEIFGLADRNNLKRLPNGDFLFRLARDLRTGIVYWAYNGTTRHVIAIAPEDGRALSDDAFAKSVLLNIADLPRRVGCGVGRIHRSWVYVVPAEAAFGASGARPEVSPVLVKGEVFNDISDATSRRIIVYENLVGSR